jgi:hypothetical protein
VGSNTFQEENFFSSRMEEDYFFNPNLHMSHRILLLKVLSNGAGGGWRVVSIDQL